MALTLKRFSNQHYVVYYVLWLEEGFTSFTKIILNQSNLQKMSVSFLVYYGTILPSLFSKRQNWQKRDPKETDIIYHLFYLNLQINH